MQELKILFILFNLKILTHHAPSPTLLLKFHRNFMKNNGANEGNNSPLENCLAIFRRSTAKPGGGLNLIIAECSPLKT